jgi:hypothetical protein
MKEGEFEAQAAAGGETEMRMIADLELTVKDRAAAEVSEGKSMAVSSVWLSIEEVPAPKRAGSDSAQPVSPSDLRASLAAGS